VKQPIAVLDYGSGNLHSVSRAIAHVGGTASVTNEPSDVFDAVALVIPGVGHFGACMRRIRDAGLDRSIKDFVATGRPVFGVCVGMQILFDGSEEDDAAGLGVLAGTCRRLPGSVKVPHMGWNTVDWTGPAHPYVAGLKDGAFFYFVHSYAPLPNDDSIGLASHGRSFTAVAARENVFATQFHPEKSGDAGLHLYGRFVEAVRAQ
jgi:imidazole glycerol-phosphate synthase subunit HisH